MEAEPWAENTGAQGTGGEKRESYEAWAQTLREEFKFSIKENTQVETEDKIRESQPKAVRKQTLVYPVHV